MAMSKGTALEDAFAKLASVIRRKTPVLTAGNTTHHDALNADQLNNLLRLLEYRDS